MNATAQRTDVEILREGINEIAGMAYGGHLGEPGDPHAKGYAARRPIIDRAREIRNAAEEARDALDGRTE